MKASARYTELSELSDEKLVHTGLELERSLLTHTFRHRLGQLENTSVLGKTRRDIARAKTLLGSREREQGLARGTLEARHRSTFVPAVAEAKGETGAGFLKGILDKTEAIE